MAMLALWLTAGAHAQTTMITQEEAINLALAHNHALLATRTQIGQSEAMEVTANLRPNPTFGADTQFIPIFDPSQFTLDNLNVTQQFDIGITYLFERGHKRQRRLQAARDATAVTRSQVSDSERMLIFNVSQEFINVLLAESTLRLATLPGNFSVSASSIPRVALAAYVSAAAAADKALGRKESSQPRPSRASGTAILA